jgi:hypothetical protein
MLLLTLPSAGDIAENLSKERDTSEEDPSDEWRNEAFQLLIVFEEVALDYDQPWIFTRAFAVVMTLTMVFKVQNPF